MPSRNKRPIVTCEDITPNGIYAMATHSGKFSGDNFEIVKIQCTKDRGWLRGFVDVSNFGQYGTKFHAQATAIGISPVNEGRAYAIQVTRENNETWEFRDLYRQPTLWQIPPEWIQTKFLEVQQQIERLQTIESFLTKISFKLLD